MPGMLQTLIASRYLRRYEGRHREVPAAPSLTFGRRAAAFTGGLTASFVGVLADAFPDPSAEQSRSSSALSSTPESEQTAN
jgi:hypothetical protein